MYEILLTRIFSVTMWHHFAFMSISIAMFGMTLGAIIVYLFPSYFVSEQVKYHLGLSSFWFAIFIILSFLVHLWIPFRVYEYSFGWWPIPLTYIIIAIPFIFSGICVCLAMTKFPYQVSKLYAADLIGSAFGCILVIYALKITDGPTAVFVTALFAGLSSIFFSLETNNKKLTLTAIIFSLLLAAFVIINTILVNQQSSLIKLKWIKSRKENNTLYEKWNSFSRIRIWGDPNQLQKPFGWSISSAYQFPTGIKQLHLNIDGGAYTPVTAFAGDTGKLDFLRYDLINLVHYVRQNAKVLVIGAGGGRDILSALVFNQKSVVGVEINEIILNAVNQLFGDFTGHLDRYPKVTFVNDEARSYVARQKEKFDIIQVSLIDTWASTAAGAFVLTENAIYTTEAWKIFLEHLTSNGILTFSRWYTKDNPVEVYRTTSLATESLLQLGVKNPRSHIVIARRMQNRGKDAPDGIGTILVSKSPFTAEDLAKIDSVLKDMQFELVLSPTFSLSSNFSTIASGIGVREFTAKFPFNITAPTDDSPFFFYLLRLRDIFNKEQHQQGIIHWDAVVTLGILLITVIVLTFLCIIVPLILTTKKVAYKNSFPLFIFFSCIGLGFMLVEISQMQRLVVFLGHPTYSLSVVLFSLLLSSGLGSYSTKGIEIPKATGAAVLRLLLLLTALIIFGLLTPYAITAFQGATTIVRILIAVMIIFFLGLFMGMAFPLGMKMASVTSTAITPWLWGLNGATSVCASVLAVAISLNSGISISFWTGFACYLLAFLSFIRASRYKLI